MSTNKKSLPLRHIDIDMAHQQLTFRDGDNVLLTAPISTAANGAGEQQDSECTPRGLHRICAKIGDGMPVGCVFVARKPTGEICSPDLRKTHPDRDWILTRILWLGGLEPGKNRGGNVDSMMRYIYIHGTPDDVDLSIPGSRGCVRIGNDDMIKLFELTKVGDRAHISE